ncbi:hypothetical protein BHE74_00046423, partial [Ensete ventricosum]
ILSYHFCNLSFLAALHLIILFVEEFGISEKQAEALLDITLRKLTILERKRFVDEAESLSGQISKLNELLSSTKLMFQLIEQEAIELKNRFGTPRCTLLEDAGCSQLEEIDVIPNEEMLLTLSEKGYVKRLKPTTFNLQHRGTIGKSVGKMRVNDSMSEFIVCHMHDHILYFSDQGIVYSARAYRIPECSRTAAGIPLVQLLSLSEGERITSIIPVGEFAEDQYLIMLTMNGYIKKVSLNAFSAIRATGIIAIQLVPGDQLKWVRRCADDDLVAIASQNGMVIVNFCNKVSIFLSEHVYLSLVTYFLNCVSCLKINVVLPYQRQRLRPFSLVKKKDLTISMVQL